ncbi:MAG: hypothetical protein AB1714_22085 [Acidobacteriota bacterium]
MQDALAHIKTLSEELHKSEAEVIALAFECGIRSLWRDRILGKYLRGQMTRDEAVSAVGIDWVELAERQHAAMQADLAWATKR